MVSIIKNYYGVAVFYFLLVLLLLVMNGQSKLDSNVTNLNINNITYKN